MTDYSFDWKIDLSRHLIYTNERRMTKFILKYEKFSEWKLDIITFSQIKTWGFEFFLRLVKEPIFKGIDIPTLYGSFIKSIVIRIQWDEKYYRIILYWYNVKYEIV